MHRPINSGQTDDIARLVLSNITKHLAYCEPWFKEGEVFFVKPPSQYEIINDKDENIINFYMMIRTRWEELNFLIESTLYSDSLINLAKKITEGTIEADDLYRAWAVWLKASQEGINKANWYINSSAWIRRSEQNMLPQQRVIDKHVKERIGQCRILNKNPEEVIESFDSEQTFFYFHPHKRKDVATLVRLLRNLQGKYIFYYPDKRVVERMEKKFGLVRGMDEKGNVILMNYKTQPTLFD